MRNAWQLRNSLLCQLQVPCHGEALPHVDHSWTPFWKPRSPSSKSVRFDRIVQCTLLDENHSECGWEIWTLPKEPQLHVRVEPKASSLIAEHITDEFSMMARSIALRPHSSPSSPWSRAPSTPSSASQSTLFVSVQVFDMQRNQAHGRVRAEPDEARFIDTRRLLGYSQHDIAEQFHIRPAPADLDAAHIEPILLLQHQDLAYNDNSRAVLVDTELHGDRFDTVIETDRYTAMVPSTINRAYILRITGVSAYCRLHNQRCIVWVGGRLINLQSKQAITVQHGTYIRVAIPPFEEPSVVPTHYAVKGCQAGLNKFEIVDKYQQGIHSDALDTDIEAMLADSPAEELEGPATDQSALLQTSFQPFPAFENVHPQPTPKTCFLSEKEPPQYFVEAEGFPQQGHPLRAEFDGPMQSWFSSLLHAFNANAAVECEEEGPVAYLDTWFLHGHRPGVFEESRPLRLDQFSQMWRADIVDTWRDRINMNQPLIIQWVLPVPPEPMTSSSIGHLLVYQNIPRDLAPVLITTTFQGRSHSRMARTGALVNIPTDFGHLKDLLRYARICLDRKCALSLGPRIFELHEAFEANHGDGFVITVEPLIDFFHVGDDQIASPLISMSAIPTADELQGPPDILDFPDFVQNLNDRWTTLIRIGVQPRGPQIIVQTWYLDAVFYRYHHATREVTLTDDFTQWERQLVHAWHDIVDHSVPTDFAIVSSSPGDFSVIHIILHQRLRPHETANLLTVHNHADVQYHHSTVAVIMEVLIRRSFILRAARCQMLCPPLLIDNSCTTWQDGVEIGDVHAFRCQHGLSFFVLIYPHVPYVWPSAEEPAHDPTASSSTSLIQTRAKLMRSQVNHRWRQTAGLVAHTQRPQRLNLTDLLPEPTFTTIDFRPVQQLLAQIRHVPLGPLHQRASIVKWHSSTLTAFASTPDWTTAPALGFSFYTDGTSAFIDNHRDAAAAVVLIVHTDYGDQFGGYRCFNVGPGCHAPQAEMSALSIAALWAIQLLDAAPWSRTPTVSFSALIALRLALSLPVIGGSWLRRPCKRAPGLSFNGSNSTLASLASGFMSKLTVDILGTKLLMPQHGLHFLTGSRPSISTTSSL